MRFPEPALRALLSAVAAHDGRFGFRKLAEHLVGSKAQALAGGRLARGSTYGALGSVTRKTAEGWLREAHRAGLLRLVVRQVTPDRSGHLVALTDRGRGALRPER